MTSCRCVLISLALAVVCQHTLGFQLSVTLNVQTGQGNSTLATFTDTENDILVSRTSLSPCVAVVAHVHNAPEMIIVNEGTLDVGYAVTVPGPPASSKLISAVLKRGEGFTYPKGLLHYQHNSRCKPVIFTATFTAAVPGTQFAARDFSVFPKEYLLAQYDGTVPAPIKTRFFVDKKCLSACQK